MREKIFAHGLNRQDRAPAVASQEEKLGVHVFRISVAVTLDIKNMPAAELRKRKESGFCRLSTGSRFLLKTESGFQLRDDFQRKQPIFVFIALEKYGLTP